MNSKIIVENDIISLRLLFINEFERLSLHIMDQCTSKEFEPLKREKEIKLITLHYTDLIFLIYIK